ncbi:MAG: hypothetical protein Q4B09_09290 [Lachnospiraceae bacterium]|nr:hypothetical protein [Lachnospiraceae bacterium]
MLINLIKYEMKAMGRILAPIYLLLIAASFLLSMTINSSLEDNSLLAMIFNRFDFIFVILFFLVTTGTAVVIAVLVIQRFYKNLLGTEGYLMFTLPVTTGQHLISKLVTALIWIALGGIAGGIGGLIIVAMSGDMAEFLEALRTNWTAIAGFVGNNNSVAGTLWILVIVLLGILASLMHVYAAFAIGHLWNNHKVLGGILAYIAIAIAQSFLSNRLIDTAQNAFSERSFTSNGLFVTTYNPLPAILVMLVFFAVYYAITWLLLERKLNLD